ncbi:MAG: SDR family oxidoreductase [Deltaproteobacteria bacterium]|nr:SDR family oxidoreductase [Deltaproteobacteria bacterium]
MARERNAVVTGGASGIGRAIGRRLARDGADVAVLDLREAEAEKVAAEIRALGRRSIGVAADVTQTPTLEAAFDRARTELGPIHILVNCAGIADFAPLSEMTEERFDRMLDVHLRGTVRCCRLVLPDLQAAGFGRIVNVSSAAALNGGGPGLTHYAAAKAGIIGFTKALARELGPVGITVNALAPGLIDTPLIRMAGAPPGLYDKAVAQLPVQRMGRPDDIAEACAYLVSDAAGFCTGQVLSPNGGAHM